MCLASTDSVPSCLPAPFPRIYLLAGLDSMAEPTQGASWRRAEILPPRPCGPSRVRAGGGALAHFTLRIWRLGAGVDPQAFRLHSFSKRGRAPARLPNPIGGRRQDRSAHLSVPLGFQPRPAALPVHRPGTRGAIRTPTCQALDLMPLPLGYARELVPRVGFGPTLPTV